MMGQVPPRISWASDAPVLPVSIRLVTNPQEGSGLGLSIIRRIMEIFEGRVVIENVRPHGLRIILEFPKQRRKNHEVNVS